MKDNDIIKALECCISPKCDNCPYDGDDLLRPCNHNMMRDVLNLINRQQIELDAMRIAANSLKMHLEIARTEIAALEEDNAAQAETIVNLIETIKAIGGEIKPYKAEEAKTITVKKFVYKGEDQNNENQG